MAIFAGHPQDGTLKRPGLICDNNDAVLQWTSEGIKIPYYNPVKGKQTIYVPDFLVVYTDANKKQHTELIEVKPSSSPR